ncbi:MAG TPA: hypothetical protein VI306_09080 [Pyrinomonadaceae bacterium]
MTLEEYLEEFVDENTQSAVEDEVGLLVTNQEAQTLGFFFISGLTGYIEHMRLHRALNSIDQAKQIDPNDADESIN